MKDLPDHIEEWEITVEHVRSGRTGFMTVTHDTSIAPERVLNDIREGAAKACWMMLTNPWHRLPDEEPT